MTIANVLVLDDSLTVRMNLADAFSAAGFHAQTSADAEQTFDKLRSERVDVLILGTSLSDANGIELFREFRDSDAGKATILLMSASEAEIHAQRAGKHVRVDAYLTKPYDVPYLIARVTELVANRGSSPGAVLGSILLIDDSATFREYLGNALHEQGHRVVTAQSGEDGLRLAGSERPAAIIVDGFLPGIDGATVIRRVRLDAALRGVPCILLTAATEAEAELHALDSGADAFVRKDEDVELILAKLSALLRASESTGHDADTSRLTGRKVILAIDDSVTYRQQIAEVLESEGYEAILAHSGEHALELLILQPVDCILLDLIMEGIGGTETCRRIKSSPALRDIPVIILTSVEGRASVLEGLAMGADDYVPKSAEFEVLKARVRAQLRRRQFEDESRRERERLMRSEMEALAASSVRELSEVRAGLVKALERKNDELETAYKELQATQAQLIHAAKMASLGELVAGVAHEINNPLAFVLSHLDTTRRSLSKAQPELASMTASAREHWDRALNRLSEMNLGLERIQELVIKLRTFSRLDEGERKTVSVRECIESLLTILGHKTKDRILVSTQFGEPDQLDCFPSLLTQAIMNLVANSIDAIAETGTIAISSGAVDGVYRIVVTDSGHGIPAELRERVMEPFFTTKGVGAGTGLGLSIAYSIVRKHAGTLVLTDADGGGTRATIDLPLHGLPGA
jgi:two-component system NtrC family sensor kinase